MQILVNVDVDNLDQASQFYVTAFGLKKGRRFGSDGIELLGGSSPIYLLVKGAGTSATKVTEQPRTYDRHWTPVHLDFVVEEIESAVQRALDAGARLESQVSIHAWGRLASMADPFGHGFCFVEFLGRGYDEITQ
jgi:predicted enzyme related to lactoylglutathione lyase